MEYAELKRNISFESAIDILENGRWWRDWLQQRPAKNTDEYNSYMEFHAALTLAIDALRDIKTPLTVEQLKAYEPFVWVWVDAPKSRLSGYYQVSIYADDECFHFEHPYPGRHHKLYYEDYGKTWLSYTVQPNREV